MFEQAFKNIKARIRRGQYQALRTANKELLDLYRDIGESFLTKMTALSMKATWASRLPHPQGARNA
jgi:hypothetical protein